jgi:hypothetical protein
MTDAKHGFGCQPSSYQSLRQGFKKRNPAKEILAETFRLRFGCRHFDIESNRWRACPLLDPSIVGD